MKTFIKWSGNKSKHINKFIDYLPDFDGTYIEPFVGSDALLLLYLEPDKWIINDLNKDLINIWKVVKKEPDETINVFTNFGKTFKTLSKDKKLELCREITNKLNNINYDYKRSIIYLMMKQLMY
jgi:DNA adenine methylase